MPRSSLCEALTTGTRCALERVSDKIVRVEVSKDWPIAEALAVLAQKNPLKVFATRPFTPAQFGGLQVTNDTIQATIWRNQPGRKFSVIIVGGTTGNLDAGLKDVTTVNRRSFVNRWRDSVLESLPDRNDLNKDEVARLLKELFSFVADGATPAPSLESYLSSLLGDPKVETICTNLWQVGLLADPRVLDHGMAAQRLRRNQELVEVLRTSTDQRIDRLLEAAAAGTDANKKNVAQRAIAYRESSDVKELRKIDLPTLEGILSVTLPPPDGSMSMGLIELLDAHQERPSQVKDCLKKLAEEWRLDEVLDYVEEEFSVKDGNRSVRVELSPTMRCPLKKEDEETLAYPWTEGEAGKAVLAAQSKSNDPEGLGQGQGQEHFFDDALLSTGQAKDEVAQYLRSRLELKAYEPWLECDGLWLLLLHVGARTAVRNFIDAWCSLADAAAKIEDGPGFIQSVQVLETIQGPLDGDTPIWIVLGPLHPFRLDPLLRTAEQGNARLETGDSVAHLGKALMWAIDRCFPAYPTIHRKDQTLTLASSRNLIVYRKDSIHYLPAARDASGLDRILRAIEGFSPWLSPGVSILTIDPPLGGGVSRALELALRRSLGRKVFVYHLATGDDADPLEQFTGDLRYLPRVSHLRDAENLPPVNVILRFVPESPSAGEAAGSNWQATKGTHLALEIGDAISGPFESEPSTRIKIDPRAGNIVVRRIQELYARFKGGRPVLATIRPMLKTDDAPILSRLAAGTDWLIFAAPGPLGLISPKTINNTLQFVGRANMGQYGLYAYAANNLFPVRRHFEEYFRKTPVATLPAEKMVDLLVTKARESGNAVLFASLGSVPAQVAALVALDIAQENVSEGDEVFVLSLDDMGWTRSWLADGTRADFLLVQIKLDGSVVFRVVESKSKEVGDPVLCDPAQEIFASALSQVKNTLRVIKEITATAEPSLDEDLRFTSLIEHLMASVLSKSVQFVGAQRKRIFDIVNALSRRELVPTFEGMAVLTQPGVNQQRATRRVDAETHIVWAGTPDVNRTFKVQRQIVGDMKELRKGAAIEDVPTSIQPPAVVIEDEADRQTEEIQNEPEPRIEPQTSEDRNAALARDFIVAARIHGVAVASSAPVYIQVGPALFAVGILLKEGTSIQPLRARLADIARDIGLGDRAHEIEVENDEKPRTVRVLLPRSDRQFPTLPRRPETLVSAGGYLPIFIGQTVDGTNFSSPLESWPHMLVAGTTGSGKTTFLKSILQQLGAFSAQKLQVIVVDGKGDTDYLGLLPPNMFPEEFPDVQLGHLTAIPVLKWTVEKMEERSQQILNLARKNPTAQGVKAADLYRNALKERRTPEIAPLVLVIDEFADIMLAGKKSADEFENLVQRVSQVGRARLIHLVLATQRPDKETIRGAIKVNLNARAVFRLPTQADSLTVLGRAGAERLMLHGDMLFQHGTGAPRRLQGYSA